MKHIFTLLIAILLVGTSANAQFEKNSKDKQDTTTVTFGKRSKFMYVKNKEPFEQEAYFKETSDGDILIGKSTMGRRKRKTFWAGIDLGLNFLTEAGNTAVPSDPNWQTEPSKSLYWGLNLLKKEMRMGGNQYFLIGLGLNYRSFTFKDFYDINVSKDTTFLSATTSIINPHKNKLRVTYLQIPMLFNFNTSWKMEQNFHIAFGLLTNIRIGSVYKQKYRLNGSFEKQLNKDDFNLKPLHADATIRVGFSSFTLFFNYALSPMFHTGRAPKLTPITFGVQLFGF